MSTTTATSQQNRPDMTFVTVIHQALRVDAGRLATAVATLGPPGRPDRVAGIAAFYRQYRDQLALHHRHEDELFFPALVARVGADAMHLAELTTQHEALDAALVEVSGRLAALADPAGDFAVGQAGAASALSVMTGLLTTHLTLEEQYALPLHESQITAAEHKRLEARARKDTPRALTRFLIPWLIAHASPDQRAALFRSAPPLRPLYWLNLPHYRRFDQALPRAA